MQYKNLLDSIEELRKKLHMVSTGRNFTDPEVVSLSQMLDTLMNEYYRLTKENT